VDRKGMGRGREGGKEGDGKYIQNTTARDLIFSLKSTEKRLAAGLRPDPLGELMELCRKVKKGKSSPQNASLTGCS